MDRRGSYEGDGGVRLYVLASSDLSRPIILRSKISKAIQDKSILPRSASQRTPSGTIASAQPSSESTKVVDHLEHSRFSLTGFRKPQRNAICKLLILASQLKVIVWVQKRFEFGTSRETATFQ